MSQKINYINGRLCIWLCLALAFSLQVTAQGTRTLSTPNPSKEASALYCYIQSIYGKKILSGQMWSSWGIDELVYVQTNTGKQPALRGMDYMSTSENNSETQHAIDWWRKGGIPTIMWHWGAPGIGEGYENSKKKIDINRCFQVGTIEYTSFWSELTKKADQLQKLRDANVPVLWRPFHELNGGWFWWGMGGADQFKRLWTTMYNYFVNDRKLNNLIWVLCYTGEPNGAWFPGNQYVDIAGADTYAVGSSPQLAMYNRVKSSIGGNSMPIAYHECGTPPDPDQCLSQGAMWSWWMEWHTSHLEAVDKAYLRRVYNHDLIITLDELPDFLSVCGGTTPANTPPTVSITSPAANASFTAPASISITANASDANGTVSSVQFFNGTTLLGTDVTAPYSFSWSGLAAGTYAITAKATDNAGAVTTSSAVAVTVTSTTTTNTPPVVNISSPVNSASFTAPASITINATATDANGTVSTVQFYNGSTLLGSDATAPYSFTWANVPAGAYSITARATDNAGATTTSLAVSVNVTSSTSTADVIGPDCGAANTALSFELNATRRANVSSYTWWYTGSAGSTTIVSGAPYRATVQTGGDFSAGQICVGVNLSVAPWYTSYCKPITRCAVLTTNNAIKAVITPNPTSDSYTLRVPEAVQSYTVTNYMGALVIKGGPIGKMASIKFGSTLPKGNYIVSLQYRDGLIETKSLQKLE